MKLRQVVFPGVKQYVRHEKGQGSHVRTYTGLTCHNSRMRRGEK